MRKAECGMRKARPARLRTLVRPGDDVYCTPPAAIALLSSWFELAVALTWTAS
jgi:hypothetical protein